MCLFPHLGVQPPRVEVSPRAGWSVLVSAAVQGHRGEVRVGGLQRLAASTSPGGGPRDVTAGPA